MRRYLVVVVGLCGGDTNPTEVAKMLVPPAAAETAVIDGPYITFSSANTKRKITLAAASCENILALLHLCAAADTVLFALSATSVVDHFGSVAVQCIRAQSTSAVGHVLLGLEALPPKRRGEAKKALGKVAQDHFPETKVHTLSAPSDAAGILWACVNQKRKDLKWRNSRSYMLAHGIDFIPAPGGEPDDVPKGTMVVRAFVRGRDLDVNRLVYLPGAGAYQIEKIVTGDLAGVVPSPSKGGGAGGAGGGMAVEDAGPRTLQPQPDLQESLQSEVPLDPFEGEQTWPTDEEIAAAQADTAAQFGAGAGGAGNLVRVPKGTSSYQAAWIADDGDSQDEDDDADQMADEALGAVEDELAADEPGGGRAGVQWADLAGQGALARGDDEETELVSLDGHGEYNAAKYDAGIDGEEEAATLEELRLARDERIWPDEVDTPLDRLAKARFQKYRGLSSFRHSPWDPREELPVDYGRVFQFHSFRQTAKRVLRDADPEDGFGAEAGEFVTVYIAGVPAAAATTWATIEPDNPLVVYALLPHENRMSVLNFKVTMPRTYDTPIKSKTRLVFYTGLRQFTACPVFSQHSVGDKHKFERYFQPGETAYATVFGPIHFSPMPTLVFAQAAGGGLELVATGGLASVSPDRMVIKRIRLAGHVFKINKRSAVLRYMFYNPEDIHWFKPVELVTAMGRRGHIRESLGTHGHMKCTFDKQLNQQDTVFMNLYKRVYPKWTYTELLES